MNLDYKELEHKVIILIGKHFKDKKDKGGSPYLEHLEMVAKGLEDPKARIVALLHDILEDTSCTIEEIRQTGCDDTMITAIQALTRKPTDTFYMDYILRLSGNKLARQIKIKDLEHNMDIRRLTKFGEYEQLRLRKYWYSWKFLKGDIGITTFKNALSNVK